MASVDGDAEQKIDVYLARLRARLRGINEQDVREIVEELRSHILDGMGTEEVSAGTVDATLAALGGPEELASEYMTDNLLARAEVSRSPLRILASLFHWASLSIAGFFAFLVSVVGYLFGVSFILCALLKPVHPQTASLWILPAGSDDFLMSVRLGFGTAPPGSRELLGWWIVPIGLVVGCGLVMLTTRFGLWCVRQYRKSRVFPPGQARLKSGEKEGRLYQSGKE